MSNGRASHGRQNRSSYNRSSYNRSSQNHASQNHACYEAWMPLYDPAFALGPFLQLPPYLSSGQVMTTCSGHWYNVGSGSIVNDKYTGKAPNVGAESIAKPQRHAGAESIAKPQPKNAQTPASIPSPEQMQVDLSNKSLNSDGVVAKRTRGGKAHRKKEAPMAVPVDTSPSVSPVSIAPSISGGLGIAEVPRLTEAPSTTIGTSTCCSSESVPEDGSQDMDTMVSARSGFTSDDASDVPKQPDAHVATEEASPAQAVLTVSTLLEILTSDKNNANDVLTSNKNNGNEILTSNKNNGARFSELLSKESQANEKNSNDIKSANDEHAVTDVIVAEACAPAQMQESVPTRTDVSFCEDGFDSKIIDPEAPNSMLDDVTPVAGVVAECETPEKAAPCCSTTKEDKEDKADNTPVEPLSIPSLDILLGTWLDSKNSHYEVRFDTDTTNSCHVKTSNPCLKGGVRETAGLIRLGQTRGKAAGRILWGSAFVLETPIESRDFLQWRSIRGGKDFTWTRDGDEVETEVPNTNVQDAGERTHASISTDSQPCSTDSKSYGQESWVQQPEQHSPGGKTITHKRVWRAVTDKQDVTYAAEPEPRAKTPSEVAASPCRRVKSHSGTWRVISKTPRM